MTVNSSRNVNDVRREDKAGNLRGSGQFVERFRLHRQETRAGFAVQNVLIQFRRVGMCAFDGSDDHLIIFTLMFARQRPDIDAGAVLC